MIIGVLLVATDLFGPPTDHQVKSWVDQTFDSMTIDQRIAQLFMIEVRPTYGKAHLDQVKKTIKDHQVGGVIFFKGNPEEQVALTNEFQALSNTKMLVAIDGEWGLAMRLSNTTSFPYQLALGAIQNDQLIFQMGEEIGRQCNRMGIHVNFAPVIDVNNNPNNPVINYRSFGEDPQLVAEKGWAYAQGMQSKGIIACAKHFPGHGDTDVDSHKDLPVINHSMERLEEVEFKPFRYVINKGIHSVMTAHLYIPAIDNSPQTAISISEKAINGILRKDMGFAGLAFTDALNMQGVAKYHPDGELELKALMAGNDILLAPGDIPKATLMIKKAMVTGLISEDYVWGKVKKILRYKRMVGLDSFQEISTANLIEDLNNSKAKHLNDLLKEKSLCLVNNGDGLIPLDRNSGKKIISIAIGNGTATEFQKELKKYTNIEAVSISKNASEAELNRLLERIKQFDLAIVSLQETSKYPKSFGITSGTSQFAGKAAQIKPMILVDFGNPYNLAKFPRQKNVLVAYEDDPVYQVKAAQALFSIVGVSGKLPISISQYYKKGMGVRLVPVETLSETDPESVGMSKQSFLEIDRIAERAVRIGATPGAQVLVAKDGQIVYNKCFGKHTYTSKLPVQRSDLYDLASITKVAATTLCIMKLVEDGEVRLDDHMAKYIPELLNTNKSFITIRMVLEHKAGLKAWIPFYKEAISDKKTYDSVFSDHMTAMHNTYVGNSLYMLDNYRSYIFQQIYESEIQNIGQYKYSDLGMILLKELIERVVSMPMDEYVDETFYKPLGLKRMTFKPLNKFSVSEIIPTALSPDMRKGEVVGFVHDPAAAMLGGVSGHAGLFGNAESLAILMQMLLDGGMAKGKQLLRPETIELFTKRQSSNSRRGLGWDKPEFRTKYLNPASDYASLKCFGHTGFTGTVVWVDPQYQLIYVFLSNRVYPDQENKKLIREGVRTEIMDWIYKSMI